MLVPFDIKRVLEYRPFENAQAWKRVVMFNKSAVWQWNWANPLRYAKSNDHFSETGRYSGVLTFRLWIGLLISLAAVLPCVAQRVNPQNRPEYFIDVLVLSDVPLYRSWYGRAQDTGNVTRREETLADMRQYFALLIREVNARYRTLENNTNFRLTVRPVAFHIAENAADSPWTAEARTGGQGQVDSQTVLQILGRWLVTAPAIPLHDHAMLLTGACGGFVATFINFMLKRAKFKAAMLNQRVLKEEEQVRTPCTKRFWTYIKHQRTSQSGVPPLKVQGRLVTDSKAKAEALNSQFFTAFSEGKQYKSTEVRRATVGSVCQGGGRSVSVIEDRGAFQSAHTAAHELGHSMGAWHDGTGNNCRATDRFIMAGNTEPRTPANLRNPWFFSLCSASAIARYVNRLLRDRRVRGGNQCLRTALPQTGVPNVDGVMPGQLYSPDQQCQHIYGPQSRYCYGGRFGRLADICTSMFCLRPDAARRNVCVQYHAAHGTTCAPGKWCEAGACTANQLAPRTAVGACPSGDQRTLFNGRRCPDAVRNQPALCYNPRVQRICCATCARTQVNNRAGCAFGDRTTGCQARLCNTLLPDGTPYGRDCCRTCNFDITRWTCADNPQGVNGVHCPTALRQGQVQGCYNATLAFSCCGSCQGQRVPAAAAGCEYGDLLLDNCENSTDTNNTCNQQLRRQCCKTCGDNDAIRRDVRYGIASSMHSHQFLQVLMWCILVFGIRDLIM
ncbi:hypothetical protein ACOMHN_026632 [Nucella lapillus]